MMECVPGQRFGQFESAALSSAPQPAEQHVGEAYQPASAADGAVAPLWPPGISAGLAQPEEQDLAGALAVLAAGPALGAEPGPGGSNAGEAASRQAHAAGLHGVLKERGTGQSGGSSGPFVGAGGMQVGPQQGGTAVA